MVQNKEIPRTSPAKSAGSNASGGTGGIYEEIDDEDIITTKQNENEAEPHYDVIDKDYIMQQNGKEAALLAPPSGNKSDDESSVMEEFDEVCIYEQTLGSLSLSYPKKDYTQRRIGVN